jgi:tRNA G18 (ribose-2'-O)-methylase SpoU
VVARDALIGAQVGDGAIVYRPRSEEAAGEIALLTAPHHGEYLNETVFLTSDGYLEHLQLAYHAGAPDALALFSDGLQMLALDMKNQPPVPHAPFFDPLFTFVKNNPDGLEREQKLRAFLESERVCAKTDDDKTLVIAVREVGS